MPNKIIKEMRDDGLHDKKMIGFEIRALNNLIKRDIENTRPPELDGSKGVHGWAIGYFFDNRDNVIFQRDFENRFSIRRSTATQILKLMEKKGLIERKSVDYDARLKQIILTEKAIEIHKKIMKDIEAREKRFKTGISEDELNSFFSIIDKIKANLEAEND